MSNEELKLTEEQETIIDIWDAESDVNTRRIDWVNFAKEILRPSLPSRSDSERIENER